MELTNNNIALRCVEIAQPLSHSIDDLVSNANAIGKFISDYTAVLNTTSRLNCASVGDPSLNQTQRM